MAPDSAPDAIAEPVRASPGPRDAHSPYFRRAHHGKPTDETGLCGTRRHHMDAALFQQLVSGDCLSRGRVIAGPVHQPGEEDLGVQGEAGPRLGRTRHVQNAPAAESAIDGGTAQNCPARRYVIDFGSNG